MRRKKLKLIFILVLSLIIALIVIQNTAPIQAHFLWITVRMPVILLLLLTAMGGFVLGILVSLFTKPGRSKL
jgi:uncharacterized integral membrane protein